VERYGLSDYYAQRLSMVEDEINSIFDVGRGFKQQNLAQFMGLKNKH